MITTPSEKIKLIDAGIKLDMEDITIWKQSQYIDKEFIKLSIKSATESMKKLIELRKSLTTNQ